MYIGNLPCIIVTLVYNLTLSICCYFGALSKGKHTHVLNDDCCDDNVSVPPTLGLPTAPARNKRLWCHRLDAYTHRLVEAERIELPISCSQSMRDNLATLYLDIAALSPYGSAARRFRISTTRAGCARRFSIFKN